MNAENETCLNELCGDGFVECRSSWESAEGRQFRITAAGRRQLAAIEISLAEKQKGWVTTLWENARKHWLRRFGIVFSALIGLFGIIFVFAKDDMRCKMLPFQLAELLERCETPPQVD